MPFVPFAYRKSNVCNSLDKHRLADGSFDGLELGRLYLPTVLLRKSAPGDGYITTGIDERLNGFSSILNNNTYRSGVLTNRANLASIELLFLSVRELRTDPEPVSGISASPTGVFLLAG